MRHGVLLLRHNWATIQNVSVVKRHRKELLTKAGLLSALTLVEISGPAGCKSSCKGEQVEQRREVISGYFNCCIWLHLCLHCAIAVTPCCPVLSWVRLG